jgi:predicted nucleic acid-binding protein
MRVVLADAGPLIGLARIQRLELLRDLFTTI